MKHQVSLLTQSKYYTPAFNGAIFDGPLRIYFAQAHEAMALKVYFSLLTEFKSQLQALRSSNPSNIFLMIYPTKEAFHLVFPGDGAHEVLTESLGNDQVIGVRGPLEDNHFEAIKIQTAQFLSRPQVAEAVV